MGGHCFKKKKKKRSGMYRRFHGKHGNSLLKWAVFLKFNDPLGSEVLTWRKSFMTSVCLQAFHAGIASCWDFLTRSLMLFVQLLQLQFFVRFLNIRFFMELFFFFTCRNFQILRISAFGRLMGTRRLQCQLKETAFGKTRILL